MRCNPNITLDPSKPGRAGRLAQRVPPPPAALVRALQRTICAWAPASKTFNPYPSDPGRAGRLAQWLPPPAAALVCAPQRALRAWAPAIGSSSTARSINPHPARAALLPAPLAGEPGPPAAGPGPEAGAPGSGELPAARGEPAGPAPGGPPAAAGRSAAAGHGRGAGAGGSGGAGAPAQTLEEALAGGAACASVDDVAYLARSLRRRVVQRLNASAMVVG